MTWLWPSWPSPFVLPGWVLGKKKTKEKDYQMVSLLNLATKLDRERHILRNLARGRAPHVTLVSPRREGHF